MVMDFSKAFDKVSHNKLIYILHHYGIRGNNNLSNRQTKVAVEGETSSEVPEHQGYLGVPVIGPCFSFM